MFWERILFMNEFTFETGMEELEKLVLSMENGNMPLEESFEAYRKGVEIYNALKKMLDEGDRRILEITRQGERDITGEGIVE